MNPYQILGISANATENEIKKAYYKLVNAYHPDIHPENKAYYEEKMKQINAAYEIVIANLKKHSNTRDNSRTNNQTDTKNTSSTNTNYNYQYGYQNTYQSTYYNPDLNPDGTYHLNYWLASQLFGIYMQFDKIMAVYTNLKIANESLKDKNYLNRLCEALNEYIKRVEPYLNYRNNYNHLNISDYQKLNEYIIRMQTININYLSYLKRTIITVSKEELFPVIRYTNLYQEFENNVMTSYNIENILLYLSMYSIKFASSSEILYAVNPNCRNYDNTDYFINVEARNFYLFNSFNYDANNTLGITTKTHAFDDYISKEEEIFKRKKTK